MAVSDQFCLRWNDHQNTLMNTFDTLLDSQKLTDVTLWAGGRCLKAHKVVLSACSPYFDNMLEIHDEKNPIIVFNDLSYEQLRAMLEYMYRGEVNVSQEQLDSFLKVAESLKIKGLTDQGGGGDMKGGGGTSSSGSKKKGGGGGAGLQNTGVGGGLKERGSPAAKRRRGAPPPAAAPLRRNSESQESVDEGSIKDERLKIEVSTPTLLQPKVELTEEGGGGGGGGPGVEDLTMEEEEDDDTGYYHHQGAGSSRLLASDSGATPAHVKAEFAGWEMTNDSFMGPGEMSGNNSLNSSQGIGMGTSPQVWYTCDACFKAYKSKAGYYLHQKFDCGKEPQFQCPECPHKSKRKGDLKRHIFTHRKWSMPFS